tara:strand:+ start:15274 stop:15456 length:183 start_codon:yes stop_codon:yes gene_type:complete
MEEENLNKKNTYELGNNLDNFSIEELDQYLLVLKEEILRIEKLKKSKINALNKAQDFFKG